MSSLKDQQIKQYEKDTRRLQYLEDHPEFKKSSCPNSFGDGRCTSGSKRGDWCNSDDPDTCPYND